MSKKLLILVILLFSYFTRQVSATDISGDIWGTLYVVNSPYNVMGELRVPSESTLVIEPGCRLTFQGHYKLVVDTGATLLAVGTPTDSITFTAQNADTGWFGIRFLNADSSSQLNYCRIEYGRANGSGSDSRGGGIYCNNTNLKVTNCLIHSNYASDVGDGIYSRNSSPLIESNEFAGDMFYSLANGGGIANPVIRANSFAGSGSGIEVEIRSLGTEYNGTSNPVVEDNTISGASTGISLKSYAYGVNHLTATLRNNVIAGGSRGIYLYGIGGHNSGTGQGGDNYLVVNMDRDSLTGGSGDGIYGYSNSSYWGGQKGYVIANLKKVKVSNYAGNGIYAMDYSNYSYGETTFDIDSSKIELCNTGLYFINSELKIKRSQVKSNNNWGLYLNNCEAVVGDSLQLGCDIYDNGVGNQYADAMPVKARYNYWGTIYEDSIFYWLGGGFNQYSPWVDASHTNIYYTSYVSGLIGVNTTWRDSVKIIGDVVFPSGVSLTIERGTKIKLSDKASQFDTTGGTNGRCDILIYGNVRIGGSSGDSVYTLPWKPLSQVTPSAGSWGSIYLINSQPSDTNRIIRLAAAYGGTALKLSNSNAIVDSCGAHDNSENGIACYSQSSTIIKNSTFLNNVSYGVYSQNSSPLVERNIFSSNKFYSLANGGGVANPVIRANNFTGSGSGIEVEIRSLGTEYDGTSNPVIEDNTISGASTGISLESYAFGVSHLTATLRNNVITGGSRGMYLYGTGVHNSYTGQGGDNYLVVNMNGDSLAGGTGDGIYGYSNSTYWAGQEGYVTANLKNVKVLNYAGNGIYAIDYSNYSYGETTFDIDSSKIIGNNVGFYHVNGVTSCHYSEIMNNISWAIYWQSGDSVDATYNYWGSTDSSYIAGIIHGNVKYIPFLLCPGSRGTIAGNIRDASTQQNLEGVLVEALQNGTVRGANITNINGQYFIFDLCPSTYDLRASKSGYETQTQMGKNLIAGQTTTVDFQLTSSSIAHCRSVGNITICAKSILDLGGGDYKAQDSVWIGNLITLSQKTSDQGEKKSYIYLGDNAALTFNLQSGTVLTVSYSNVHLSAKGLDYEVSDLRSMTVDAQAGEVRFEGAVHYHKDAIFQNSFSGTYTLQVNSHRLLGTVKFDDNYFGAGSIGLNEGQWDLEGCPFFGIDAEINLISPLPFTELSCLNGRVTIGVFLNTGIFRIGLTDGAFEFTESGGAYGLDLTGLIAPPGIPSQGMIDIDPAHLRVNVVKDIPIGLPLPLLAVEQDSTHKANEDLIKGKIDWRSIKKVGINTYELIYSDQTGKRVPLVLADLGLTIKGEESYTDLNCNGRYDLGEPFEDEDQDGVWDEGTSFALIDEFQNPIFKAHGHATLDLTLAKYINFTCADAVMDIDFPTHNRIDLQIWTGLKLGNIFNVDLATGYLYLDFKDRKYYAGATLGDPYFDGLAFAVDLLVTFEPFEFSAKIKEDYKALGVDFLATDAVLRVDDQGFNSSCDLDAFHILNAQGQFAFRPTGMDIDGTFISDFHIDGWHLAQSNNMFHFGSNECFSVAGSSEYCIWKLCKNVPFSCRICSFTDWHVSLDGLTIGLGSPANLHVYDSQGRHTGINSKGGIDTQIPGSEFYKFNDVNQQLVYLPDPDLVGGYTIDVKGLVDSVFELNMLYPNKADGRAYNVSYFDKPTKKGALHRVNLDINNNWTMLNDLNGDSIFESQVKPDSIAQANLDSSMVTISQVSSRTSGDSAIVSWSTNLPATSKVLYRSVKDSLYKSVADTVHVISHNVSIDSLTIGTYYYLVSSVDASGNIASFLEKTLRFGYSVGDANRDGNLSVSDVVYLINYLFKGGPTLNPLEAGDVNCDGKVTVSDVVYLINYLFRGGPPPCS